MLRQVYITRSNLVIYEREFGKALDKEDFDQVFKQISGEAFKIATTKSQFHDYFKYRVHYLSTPETGLIFIFVTDLSDKFNNVKKELTRCRKEFLNMFEGILDEKLDADTFEIYNPTIDLIHKNLRPKISLIGFSGVGKTTITRLITAEDIPMEHIPTITGDIGTIKIGKLHFNLWDFAGQEQFSFLWGNFIKGSDAVLLITDSTLENCEKSKYFTELIKKEAPYAHVAAIGNKQDLPDAMSIADIERHLGIKAYSMIATDPSNRNKMITIIGDILEMAGEVSPLLKPLIERDQKMKEAEKALEDGDFEKAAELFEMLADFSLELGDDRVSQDFHLKAQKIHTILSQAQVATPPSPEPEVQKRESTLPATPPPPVYPPSKATSPPAPPVQAPPTATPPPAPPVQAPPTATPPPAPPVQAPPKVTPPPAPPVQAPPKATPPLAPLVQAPPKATPPPAPPVQAPPKETPPLAPLVQAPPKATPPPAPPVQAPPKETPPLAPPIQAPPIQAPPIVIATPAPKSAKSAASGEVPLDKLGALLQKLKAKQGPTSPQAASPPHVTSLPSPLQPLHKTPPPPVPPVQVPPKATPTRPSQPAKTETALADDVDKIITELKIKVAKVNKNILDMEMQNIMGELSDDDFKAKTERMVSVRDRMIQQIKELK